MLIWFWGVSALLAAGAAVLVALFARREAGRAGSEDPALAVHRRQLAELNELAERGLLNAEDQEAARTEAARRLLSSRTRSRRVEGPGTAASRRISVLAAVLAAGLALALYVTLGAPGDPDQPFKVRLASWRSEDPGRLRPAEMAAVLKTIATEHPRDPRVFAYLGRAESAAGDPVEAARAFRRAAALDPRRPEYPVFLGEALVEGNGGKPDPEAQAAFARALTLDPRSLPALFDLGRLEVLSGRRASGLGRWRSLAQALPPGDPRRPSLEALISRVAAGGPPDLRDASQGPAGDAGGAPAFIRGMVASLAARLKAQPNDPEGWARLVRSYGVLHDRPAQDAALAEARRVFRDHPDEVRAAEAEAKNHPA